jgi:hypothetical protein
MATGTKALQAAIKLVADAVDDTVETVAAGGNPITAVLKYENLIGDLITLVPQIGEIPAEAKALTPADYVALVNALVADLGVTDAHAGSIIEASVALLSELATTILPKVQALIAAVKGPIKA